MSEASQPTTEFAPPAPAGPARRPSMRLLYVLYATLALAGVVIVAYEAGRRSGPPRSTVVYRYLPRTLAEYQALDATAQAELRASLARRLRGARGGASAALLQAASAW